MDVDDALALGARCGAACFTGKGPYEAQLTADAGLSGESVLGHGAAVGLQGQALLRPRHEAARHVVRVEPACA